MIKQVLHRLFLCIFWCMWPFCSYAAPAAPSPNLVTDIQIADRPDFTRVVVNMTKHVDYRVLTLQNPHRIVIDFPSSYSSLSHHFLGRPFGKVVKKIRRSSKLQKDLRIVLDLDSSLVSASTIRKTALVPPTKGYPYRLMIDIAHQGTGPVAAEPAAPSTITAKVPTSSPLTSAVANSGTPPSPQAAPSNVTRPPRKPMIVLDPGHGGDDPGAIGGAYGTYEKYLTLRYAYAVKKALERTGRYKVLMTRSKDQFVRLGERVNKARKAKADIFIALHADSHPDSQMRGLSVYTLSETASDKEAEALAAQANKSDIIQGVNLSKESKEVTNVLIDLMQRETKNISADFAELVVTELSKEVTVLRNTHRFAGFKVLKGIDVPAVLIELGYLSNPQEEKLLNSETYKKKILDALVRALDAHFAKLPKSP